MVVGKQVLNMQENKGVDLDFCQSTTKNLKKGVTNMKNNQRVTMNWDRFIDLVNLPNNYKQRVKVFRSDVRSKWEMKLFILKCMEKGKEVKVYKRDRGNNLYEYSVHVA